MAPAWDELEEYYAGQKKVVVGDVDCTTDRNKKLCEQHEVKSYPTIKAVYKAEVVKFTGMRKLDEMEKWAAEMGSQKMWDKRIEDDATAVEAKKEAEEEAAK